MRVGADAMLCMAYPGSTDNEQTLEYMALLAAEADRYNLPVGVEALPYGFENTRALTPGRLRIWPMPAGKGWSWALTLSKRST